jgi:hypothetical protein
MGKDPDHPSMPVGLAADELLQVPAQRPLHPPLTGQVNTIHGLLLRRFFAAHFFSNLKCKFCATTKNKFTYHIFLNSSST